MHRVASVSVIDADLDEKYCTNNLNSTQLTFIVKFSRRFTKREKPKNCHKKSHMGLLRRRLTYSLICIKASLKGLGIC